MENVDIKISGSKMTITVDLTKRLGLSGSGKSEMIATTSGNIDAGGGIKVGLSVYTKAVAAGKPQAA